GLVSSIVPSIAGIAETLMGSANPTRVTDPLGPSLSPSRPGDLVLLRNGGARVARGFRRALIAIKSRICYGSVMRNWALRTDRALPMPTLGGIVCRRADGVSLIPVDGRSLRGIVLLTAPFLPQWRRLPRPPPPPRGEGLGLFLVCSHGQRGTVV